MDTSGYWWTLVGTDELSAGELAETGVHSIVENMLTFVLPRFCVYGPWSMDL